MKDKIIRLIRKLNIANTGIRIFMVFAAVLLSVTLVIGISTYYISYTSLMEQTSRGKNNLLEQAHISCERSLKKIEEDVLQKTSDPMFNQFLISSNSADYGLMDSIIQQLINFKYSSSLIQSAYLYLPDKGLILTSNDGIWQDKDFYDLSWVQSLGKYSEDYWLPTRKITTNIKENLSVVTLIVPISKTITQSQTAYFVVNLYESAINKIIQVANPTETESVSIIDKSGNIIAADYESVLNEADLSEDDVNLWLSRDKNSDWSYTFPRGKYLIYTIKSDYNGWIYTYTVAKSAELKPLSSIKLLSGFSIFGCFVIGALFVFLMISKIFKPISETIHTIKNYNEKYNFIDTSADPVHNEMEMLKQTFNNVIDNNINLRDTIKKNDFTLKKGFIFNLIVNNPDIELDWKQQMESSHIKFPHTYFYIFAVKIDKYLLLSKTMSREKRNQDLVTIKQISSDLINKNGEGMAEQTSKNNFIIIFNSDCDRENVLSIAEQIREKVDDTLGITVTIGISDKIDKIEDIVNAYNEAMEKMELSKILGGNRLITKLYPKSLKENGMLLSTQKEGWMISILSSGNIKEMEEYLDKIISDERKYSCYDVEEIFQVYYFILVQITRIIFENGWSLNDIQGDNVNLFHELNEYENINDMKIWLVSLLNRMNTFITGKKEIKNQIVMEQIIAYIDSNYSKDISLNSIADYVYLSASYISRLFKKSLGKNYSDYLTEVRIQHAKELLKNNEYKIMEIARLINVGNAQNFIRMFKKYEGVTPGEYRTNYNIKNHEQENK